LPDTLLAKALDALPNAVFLYDRDLRVRLANAAALQLSAQHELSDAMLKRPGEVLHCINARVGPAGCGSSPACERCLLRGAIGESLTTQTIVRQHMRLERDSPSGAEVLHLLVCASPFTQAGDLYVLVEMIDETELVELRGLLAVCGRCGKSRVDDVREGVDDYLTAHPGVAAEALCEACRATGPTT
jgi:PAS domain-containing protein